MGVFDHWQPILTSRQLRKKPVGVTICGEELVVFRTSSGVGVLKDKCPHRGMRLSTGSVQNQRLVCPYHGWSYATDGQGQSPGTPRLHACADHFEAVELHGLVWMKEVDAAAPFPAIFATGTSPVCLLDYSLEAPLELVLDNFNEVEHTPTTHALFGYPIERMHEVSTRTETTDTTVRVVNKGPQRPVPGIVTALFDIHPGDEFVDDWTTYFSPVYSVFDQYWTDPANGRRRAVALRVVAFFTPITEQKTRLFVYVFSSAPAWSRGGLYLLLQPALKWLVDREVRLDRRMIEALADKSPGLEGKKLSRFDKALGENRRRLQSIYRGLA